MQASPNGNASALSAAPPMMGDALSELKTPFLIDAFATGGMEKRPLERDALDDFLQGRVQFLLPDMNDAAIRSQPIDETG
jgi:hypothetical protein